VLLVLGEEVGVQVGWRDTRSARLAHEHAVGVDEFEEVHVGYSRLSKLSKAEAGGSRGWREGYQGEDIYRNKEKLRRRGENTKG